MLVLLYSWKQCGFYRAKRPDLLLFLPWKCKLRQSLGSFTFLVKNKAKPEENLQYRNIKWSFVAFCWAVGNQQGCTEGCRRTGHHSGMAAGLQIEKSQVIDLNLQVCIRCNPDNVWLLYHTSSVKVFSIYHFESICISLICNEII